MSADSDDPDSVADDSSQGHTGEGVDTIGGRESSREENRDWEFSLSDIEEREQTEDDGGNIAGSLVTDEPLEAGDIDLENALFVLLGVLIVVVLIASLLVSI